MASGTFTGAGLSLQTLTLVGQATLRVRFTQDPFLVNPGNANDGLHTANYTLTGPNPITITGAAAVGGDPQSVDLLLSAALTTGTWTLTVANIQTPPATGLTPPTTMQIAVTFVGSQVPVNGNASNDSTESLLRKFLNPALKGPAWSALLAALATGDTTNLENAESSFDQLFLVSAGGFYLDRLAGDVGVQRPINVGMSDELFSKFAIRTSIDKLTQESFNEVLEIMYGVDSVRAFAFTGEEGDLADQGYEPYALADQDTLHVLIDGVDDLVVTFNMAQFEQIAQASAIEVAAFLTESFRTLGSNAYAVSVLDIEDNVNRVRIYSPSLGLSGSVQVLGGRAQNALLFNDLVDVYLNVNPLPTWTITYTPATNVLRYSATGATAVDLRNLHTGDYVNIFGTEFNAADQGSFTIINSGFTAPNTHFFEVVNVVGVAGSVLQLNQKSMLFFRPVKRTIHEQGIRAAYVSQAAGSATVVIPATSLAVQRTVKHAAYNQVNASLTLIGNASGMTRNSLGTVQVTYPSHGLQTGDQIIVDAVSVDPAPAPLLGSPGSGQETAFSQNTITSTAGASSVGRKFHEAIKLVDDRVALLGGENANGGGLLSSTEEFMILQKVTPAAYSIPIGGMVRTGGVLVTVTTSVSHGLITGQLVFLTPGEANFPAGVKGITVTGVNTFTYPEAGANVSSSIVETFSVGQIGTKAYDYAKNATGGLLVAREFAAAALIPTGPRAGQVLVTGGQTTGNAMFNSTELYIPGPQGSTSASLLGPTLAASKSGHRATFLTQGTNAGKVLIVGGLTGNTNIATTACALYTPATNTMAATGSIKFAHVLHSQTLLQNGKVLAAGGKQFAFLNDPTSLSNVLVHQCELYDPTAGTWSTTGNMSYARFGHGAVLLPDGRVLVVGGYGYRPTVDQPGIVAPFLVKDAEIYDPNTGFWSPCGRIQTGRYFPIVSYNAASNRVYVTGGNTLTIEYYDVARGQWFVSAGTLFANRPFASGTTLQDGEIYISGGDFTPPTSSLAAYVLIPNSEHYFGGHIGGSYRVVRVDANTFQFQTSQKDYGGFNPSSVLTQQLTFTASKAFTSTYPGPYTFDPHGGVAATSNESTITQALVGGQQYSSVSVASASAFPDSPGWLVFGFGTSQQVGPVKYLGRMSATSLSLDFSFKFPSTISSGAAVTLLLQQAPWNPDASELGAFYITPSPAGRIAAEQTITDISAAGINLEQIVVYPGDRGLGAAGYPVRENYKLSDIVAMFAGDQVSEDVTAAREL